MASDWAYDKYLEYKQIQLIEIEKKREGIFRADVKGSHISKITFDSGS